VLDVKLFEMGMERGLVKLMVYELMLIYNEVKMHRMRAMIIRDGYTNDITGWGD